MNTVHELRQAGYKIFIKHVREFIGIRKVDDDYFMTRGEYQNALENGELAFEDIYAEDYYRNPKGRFGYRFTKSDRMPDYSEAVDSLGGWTQVEVVTPEGPILKGKYSFADKPFCRRKGLQIALSKALGTITHLNRQVKKKQKQETEAVEV